MKKLLYTLLAAATLLAVGCEKETRFDGPGDGALVQATFNVGFADAATKAISDGKTATQLVVGVYDKSTDALVPSLSWAPTSADHKTAFADGALSTKFTANLVKGHEYKIVFLAVAPDNGVYTIDLANKTFTAAVSGASNAENRDAFYGTWETTEKVSAAISANVTLKRPFAQVNVIDLKADYEAAAEAGVTFKESSLKITAPTVMNIMDGTVGTPAAYDFAKAAMATAHPDFDPYKTAGDYWMLTDYVLAGTASDIFNLEFAIFDNAGVELVKYPVANVPLQRNYRTNIYGSLLTAGGEFVITIDPEYEGMSEFPIEGKVPEITWTDTSLKNYADGTPLEFTLGDKTTINFAATHPLATIKPTYTSSNTAVGTINEAGLFTVVGAGTTIVTVAFPAVIDGVAVKGADDTFASYSISYTVKINAPVVEPVDAELAVTGTPTAAVEPGATFDLTVTTKSDAAVTVAVSPTTGATVGTPVNGKYTVTAAANLTADTEVTVTFSQVATEAYKAASKDVKFTVKKKADDPATNKTVADLIALADNTEFTGAEGLVVAKSQRGVVVTDGTNNILLYNWANNACSLADLAIGDKVTFDGTKKSYNGVPEIDPISNVVVASSNNTVTYPTAKDINETFDAYTASVAEFITFTGTLAVSGNYINVNVEGATTNQGSVSYPIDKTNLVDGNKVKLTGYYNGKSGGKYINIILTNVEVLGSTPTFGVTISSEGKVPAEGGTRTITVSGNVAWTVAQTGGATLDKTSGEGAGTVTVTFPANTSTTVEPEYTLTVTTTADVAQKVYTFNLTQSKVVEGATTITVDFSTNPGGLPEGSANKTVDEATYTFSGHEFKIAGSSGNGYYWQSDGYLLIGKQGAYITLPVVDGKKLIGVAFKTGSNASENVIIDIHKADGTDLNINTEKCKKATDYDWVIDGAADTQYMIYVENAYNAQFVNLTLTYN